MIHKKEEINMEECKTTTIFGEVMNDMHRDIENVCRKRQAFLNNHSERMVELNEAIRSLNETINSTNVSEFDEIPDTSGNDNEIMSELDVILKELDEL